MTNIPPSIKSLFWDIDTKNLEPSTNSHFIIKRVLDRGNTENVNWLLNSFNDKEIIETISTSRDLTQKTANFWADIYNLDKTKVAVLQKTYDPIPWGIAS